ncbi:GNAT family N-acetyltransferase [Solibacillus isronensis]|uniref:GNAT family N-acetyltransferase n=1 Tax=Solibacillus isronensis TaxID=412383 RepID=UPI0039A362C8
MKIEMSIDPAKAVKVIHQAFKRYETDPQPSSALNETADSISSEIKQGTEMFGVYDNDELIALVKCIVNKEFIYFSRLSVLPKNQGKGVATNLVKYLEDYAVQNNIFVSKCKVRKSEKNNIALYSKLGYKIVKEEIIINKNGDEIPALTMQKNLTI